ncbi:MAG TPA: hypothetical protein VIP70_12340 [Nitrososphaeraceae archaeon]
MYAENTKGLATLLKEYFYILFVRSTTGYCRDRRAIFDQIDSINRNKVEVRRGWIQFPLLFKKSTDLVTKALYRKLQDKQEKCASRDQAIKELSKILPKAKHITT